MAMNVSKFFIPIGAYTAQLDFVGSIRLREVGDWILALPSGSRSPPGGDKGGDPLNSKRVT